MKIELRGFGSARALSGQVIEVTENITIRELRQIITQQLTIDDKLHLIINTCAFANTQQVLTEDEILANPQLLNVLPPVCGG